MCFRQGKVLQNWKQTAGQNVEFDASNSATIFIKFASFISNSISLCKDKKCNNENYGLFWGNSFSCHYYVPLQGKTKPHYNAIIHEEFQGLICSLLNVIS